MTSLLPFVIFTPCGPAERPAIDAIDEESERRTPLRDLQCAGGRDRGEQAGARARRQHHLRVADALGVHVLRLAQFLGNRCRAAAAASAACPTVRCRA